MPDKLPIVLVLPPLGEFELEVTVVIRQQNGEPRTFTDHIRGKLDSTYTLHLWEKPVL